MKIPGAVPGGLLSGSQCEFGPPAVKPQERENSPSEGRWEFIDELLSSGIGKGYLPTIMIQSNSNLLGAVGQDLEGPRAGAYRHLSWGQLQSPDPSSEVKLRNPLLTTDSLASPTRQNFGHIPFSRDHSSSNSSFSSLYPGERYPSVMPVNPPRYLLPNTPLLPALYLFASSSSSASHQILSTFTSQYTLPHMKPLLPSTPGSGSNHWPRWHLFIHKPWTSYSSHLETLKGSPWLGIKDDPHCGDKETKVWPHKRYKWDLSHRFWGLHDNGGRLLRGPGQRLLLTLCSDY